jgi:hypothetical protein
MPSGNRIAKTSLTLSTSSRKNDHFTPLRLVFAPLLSRPWNLPSLKKIKYWCQRSKIRLAIEGDENTNFFHTHASHRLRNNNI